MTTTEVMIGRLMRSAITGFIFGCSVPEPEVPTFGAFVKVPVQAQKAEVIGVIYNIIVTDDDMVKQLVANPGLSETYIQDQRQNRQVPLEVSVLAVGYRNGSDYQHALSPQPPLTLERVSPCSLSEIYTFTRDGQADYRFDFMRLILEAREVPQPDELLAATLKAAMQAWPEDRRRDFLVAAGRECVRLMSRDLTRLDNLVRRLRA